MLIPNDDIVHLLDNVPLDCLTPRSLQQACDEGGLIPTSLHDAVSDARAAVPARPEPGEFRAAAESESPPHVANFLASLEGICGLRSDTRLSTSVEKRGDRVVARLWEAREDKFDTSFIDGEILRGCAAAGFSEIVLAPGVLVMDRRSVRALCRHHGILLTGG